MTSQKDILIKRLRTMPRVQGVTPPGKIPPPPPGGGGTGTTNQLQQIQDLLDGNISAVDLLNERLLETFVGGTANLEAYRKSYEQLKTLFDSSIKTLNTLNKTYGGAEAGAGMLYKTLLSVNKGLVDITKATSFYEERNVKLSKALGITTTAGTELGAQIDNISTTFNLGSEATRKYAENIEMQFAGLGAIISQAASDGNAYAQQLFLANQILVDQYQLSEDAANNLINLGMQQGMTAAQTIQEFELTAKAIEETTGNTGMLKEILQDVSAISATNSSIFGKYPAQLGIATFTARRLGASFDDIANAARGALNIEQSIASELEYQLITGQKINAGNKNILQEFRKAYLTGDAAGMAQSYEQIFETQGELIKNNVVAADSLAAAMGISTEELLRQNRVYEARNQLEEQFEGDETVQQLLSKKKLEIDDIATLQDKLQELKEQEAAGDQTAAAQVTALQEFLGATKTQESSTEMLIRSLDSLEATIATELTKIAPGLTDVQKRKTAVGTAAATARTAETGLIDTLSTEQNKELVAALGTLGLGTGVISNIIGAFRNVTALDDFILRPGQPPISMRKDDILIGATDPFGERTNASSTRNTNMSADMIASAVTTALQAANLNVTVKLDPLAVQTEAKFKSTRLNRTV